MGLFRRKKPDPNAVPATPPAGASPPAPAAAPKPDDPNKAPAPTKATPVPTPVAPAAGATTGPASVTLIDGFGRPLQVPREQWRKEVLPQVVQAYQHAPDKLAGALMQYVREGLAVDLLPSALRLAALDPEPERGLGVLAAIQRECGDFDAALATLAELQQKRPASPVARIGVAAVRDKQGDRTAATALLWAALQMDANQPDAVVGWLAWERERRTDAEYDRVLAEACALPGSWRAQLWRARFLLERNQADAAIADYRAVAARVGDDSDALWMMVTDLGRANRNELVAELVLPRYRIERHHPGIGIGLLQHFLATRQPERGMELLHELRVRFQRALDGQLGRFDAEFTRMAAPPMPASVGQPKAALYRMDRPLWYAALGEPAFLLPKASEGVATLLAGLAVQVPAAAAQVTREDEMGRLSRSVPLFLAEQLWLAGRVPAAIALPVADIGGWIVSGVPWAEDRLASMLAEEERRRLRIVTGVVRPEGAMRHLELWVYDCAKQQRIGQVTASGTEGKLGEALLQLLAGLSPLLGGPAELKPPVGSDVFWDRYATAQAQLAALVVAQAGAMPRDRVYGHRAILEWLLAVALEERRSVQPRLLLSAGICADMAIGSKVHLELAAPFAELFRIEPPTSPFAQTAFLPLRALGLVHLWQHRRQEIVAAGGDGLRAWLQRVEASPIGTA